MNKKDLMIKRNKTARLVKYRDRILRNTIRVNPSNSFVHELAKFLICWDLSSRGKHYITEANFETGGRADILVLDEGEAIEIMHSETEEKLKQKSYPVPVYPVRSWEVIQHYLPLIELFYKSQIQRSYSNLSKPDSKRKQGEGQ